MQHAHPRAGNWTTAVHPSVHPARVDKMKVVIFVTRCHLKRCVVAPFPRVSRLHRILTYRCACMGREGWEVGGGRWEKAKGGGPNASLVAGGVSATVPGRPRGIFIFFSE